MLSLQVRDGMIRPPGVNQCVLEVQLRYVLGRRRVLLGVIVREDVTFVDYGLNMCLHLLCIVPPHLFVAICARVGEGVLRCRRQPDRLLI